jgi:regulator of sigma E protease
LFKDFTFVQIVLAILGLGALIAWHEFGHYLLARLCGMRVIKFSLGIGPKIIGFTRSEIEYCVSIFLFGGYVRIFGMTPYEEGAIADPRAYINRPRWQRILVIAAGPFFNYALAFGLFSAFFWFYSAGSVRVQEVVPASAAETAGLLAGDTIVRIDGKDLLNERDFLGRIQIGQPMQFEIERERGSQLASMSQDIELMQQQLDLWENPSPAGAKEGTVDAGAEETVPALRSPDAGMTGDASPGAVPSLEEQKLWRAQLAEATAEMAALKKAADADATKLISVSRRITPLDNGEGRYLLGVRFQFVHDRRPGEVSITNVLLASTLTCWQKSVDTLRAFGQLFKGEEGVELSGPLAIGQHITKAVERGVRDYIWILAMLSLTLGLFNLLPIPALDGIKILVLLAESIVRRDLSPAIQVWVNAIGLVLLLGLMVVMTIFDAAKIWGG